MSHRVRSSFVVTVGAVCALVLFAVPAPSDAVDSTKVDSTKTVSRHVSTITSKWIPDFRLCVKARFEADMLATRRISGTGQSTNFNLGAPRFEKPRYDVWFSKSCNRSSLLVKRHQADTVDLRAFSYGYKCSYNPSFSFSAPWSVGVSVTPDCGDEKVAYLRDFQAHTTRSNHFSVASDGIDLRWDDSRHSQGARGAEAAEDFRLCSSLSAEWELRDTAGKERKKRVVRAPFLDVCVGWND